MKTCIVCAETMLDHGHTSNKCTCHPYHNHEVVGSNRVKSIERYSTTCKNIRQISRNLSHHKFSFFPLSRHFQSRLYSKSLLFRSGRTGLKIAPLLKLGSLETQTHPLEHSLTHFDYLSLSLPISSTLTIHSHSLLYNKHSLSLFLTYTHHGAL